MNNENFNIDITEEEEASVVSQEEQNFTQKEESAESQAPIYKGFSAPVPLPKEFVEKGEIKGAAITVGATLLSQTGLIALLNLAIIIVYQATSGAFNLYDAGIMQVVQIIFSITAFTLPFIVIPKIRHHRISDLIEFGKPQKGTFLPFFLFGIAFCAFSNVACSYAGAFFESFGVEYEVDFGDNPTGIFGFLLSLIATVVTPALVEEFAFRGVVQGILKKYGKGFAITASALLFGLMHGNFEQIPFAFLVGLGIGYAVEKCGTIWVGVAIHAFNNSISVFFEYILKTSDMIENIACTLIFIVCMLLGLLSLIFFNGKEAQIYSFEKSELECSEIQKYKWFFLSAPIIVFTVLCLFEASTFFI